MRYNPDTSTWRWHSDVDAVDIISSLHKQWRDIAAKVMHKTHDLTDYEMFCIVFAAGCPVRLTKNSTLEEMEWETPGFFMEHDGENWVVHWREFPNT